MDDEQFLSGLEACTLPAEHFNHAGHLRLACLYLARHSLDEAVERTCATIRAYATSLADAPAMLALHYSPALLDAPASRATFMPPDLAPLP